LKRSPRNICVNLCRKLMRRKKRFVASAESGVNRVLDAMIRQELGVALKGVDSIHVGCGDRFVEGWLNVGLFPENRIPYGCLLEKEGVLVLNLDMTEGLPVSDGQLAHVYASHFMEHLTFADGVRFLERCQRMMASGGIIRLTFPDLELWIRKYAENDTAFFEKYRSIYLKDKEARTKGQVFMSQVHGFGHQWNYDFEGMKDILEKAGFSDVTRKQPFDSLIPGIGDLEPKDEGRLLETVYVEARKR
jgi:predicted SAM-dependent methyltransferase